jgi:hypothetical protein
MHGLSDQQIERYSRQILIVGGNAQERLLASRIVIIGAAVEVETALRYLVGAGVGTIGVHLLGEDSVAHDKLLARVRELNSDVTIQSAKSVARPDLRLMIISDESAFAAVKSQTRETWHSAVVVVRLDPRAKIAILPDHTHTTTGPEEELFAPWSREIPHDSINDNAGFVTMVAVTEILKLLTESQAPAGPVVIEFDGYQTKPHPLARH